MNLLPCPFCGAKNPLFNIASPPPGPIVSKPGWFIRCRSAKCSVRLDAATAPAALKRWNTRPSLPQ